MYCQKSLERSKKNNNFGHQVGEQSCKPLLKIKI